MSPSQLFARFERRFAERVPALGLAVFRIACGLVLMLEVAQLLYFRELVFVEVPALAGRPQWTAAVLVAWLAALVLLVLGLLTRVAAAASYLFTLVTLDRLGLYAYHHDYLVTGVGFLLLFLPVSRADDVVAAQFKLNLDQLANRGDIFDDEDGAGADGH